MITATPKHDAALKRRLASLTTRDRDYWSFKSNSRREQGHALCHYPAMMVPQVARAVLQEACTVHPEIEWVGDPFVGSGTVLTETMSRGLNFIGMDINPLAILLCKAKAGPFFPDALKEKTAELFVRVDADRRCAIETDVVATSAARHRALRSLPIVTHDCDSREGEDKKAGSRVKH